MINKEYERLRKNDVDKLDLDFKKYMNIVDFFGFDDDKNDA